jgi:hypothetical protein
MFPLPPLLLPPFLPVRHILKGPANCRVILLRRVGDAMNPRQIRGDELQDRLRLPAPKRALA